MTGVGILLLLIATALVAVVTLAVLGIVRFYRGVRSRPSGICPKCGHISWLISGNYCPQCGASMDSAEQGRD